MGGLDGLITTLVSGVQSVVSALVPLLAAGAAFVGMLTIYTLGRKAANEVSGVRGKDEDCGDDDPCG